MKVTNILVPIDFSPCSEQALDDALDLAAQLGATVQLLHVIGIPSYGVPELGVGITATMMDNLIADNQAALDQLARARKGVGQTLVRAGLRSGAGPPWQPSASATPLPIQPVRCMSRAAAHREPTSTDVFAHRVRDLYVRGITTESNSRPVASIACSTISSTPTSP
jgi:hypothetical protein